MPPSVVYTSHWPPKDEDSRLRSEVTTGGTSFEVRILPISALYIEVTSAASFESMSVRDRMDVWLPCGITRSSHAMLASTPSPPPQMADERVQPRRAAVRAEGAERESSKELREPRDKRNATRFSTSLESVDVRDDRERRRIWQCAVGWYGAAGLCAALRESVIAERPGPSGRRALSSCSAHARFNS